MFFNDLRLTPRWLGGARPSTFCNLCSVYNTKYCTLTVFTTLFFISPCFIYFVPLDFFGLFVYNFNSFLKAKYEARRRGEKMKILQELKFEELSTEQKLGMLMAGIVRPIRCEDKYETFDENLEFVLDLIKHHSLGAVWVPQSTLTGVPGFCDPHPDVIKRIREAADYPILIFTDAESGFGEYQIGRHNAIGVADSEELAYTFGKVTAIMARKMGYNVICDPVLDMTRVNSPCGGAVRSLGGNKYRVTELAVAEAQGLHDGGVLTVAKHYPSAGTKMDSHMAPNVSDISREELIDYKLYPYIQLAKRGLIDGIMSSHQAVACLDGDMPTSVSLKITNLIRELGFDGFMVTDALDMMGLKARFGDTDVKGLVIAGGNEFALPWFSARKAYNDIKDCFERGIISPERLDEATRRVLAAQHKVALMEERDPGEITDEDKRRFNEINANSVFVKTDDGVPTAISREGRHFFLLTVKNESDIKDDGKVTVDTFTNGWFKPARITKKIEELFPNSTVRAIYQFPTPNQNMDVLQDSLEYDDIVVINCTDCPAYAGSDSITHRLLALYNALQLTNRISTFLHFDNPFVAEELPHAKRLMIGGAAADSIDVALEALAGLREPKGHLTYDINLK